MKKSICIVLALIMLLASGCHYEKGRSTGVSIQEFQKQSIVLPDVNDKSTVVFEALTNEMRSVGVEDKVGTRYLGVKSQFNATHEQLDSKGILVEVAPYKEIPLQYPANFPQWQVGSGSTVIMENRYVYEWHSYDAYDGDGSSHDMKLTCKDMETGKVSVANEVQLNHPLVYLLKLDDTHFLSYYVTKTESDKLEYATLAVAEIYDIRGSHTEIIREKYENDVDWTDSIGTLIERFTIVDGEIYGLGRRRASGKYTFYLYHYGRDGKLLDTQKIPDLEKVIDDDQPLEFHLVGEYIVIRTYKSSTAYICRWTKNGLGYIAKGENGNLSYDISKDADGSYLCFIESNVNDDASLKEKDCPLYVINARTHMRRKLQFTIPLEKPYFVNMRRLSTGDLLFTYCDGQYDPLNFHHFLLSKEELQKHLP